MSSLTKVKAAVGPHEIWWADEPLLQNWVIGSVFISIWWQLFFCAKSQMSFLFIKISSGWAYYNCTRMCVCMSVLAIDLLDKSVRQLLDNS